MDALTATTGGIDIQTQTILLYASQHNIEALKPLLRIPGNASVQDPETGFTPLHAAIAACGEWTSTPPTNTISQDSNLDLVTEGDGVTGESAKKVEWNTDGEEVDIAAACETIKELLLGGAIWNDLDVNDETPGCLAFRLGWRELYFLCVEAGVRAEVLLGLMGGYEELDGGSEDEEEEEEEEEEEGGGTKEDVDVKDGKDGANTQTQVTNGNGNPAETHHTTTEEKPEDGKNKRKRDVNSKDYLSSTLTLNNGNLLDADNNGVMMTWETSIMQQSVDLLLPSSPQNEGLRILNIGFGLGIIDTMFASLDPKPSTHHIIEAHPDVLKSIAGEDSKFGASWESSALEEGRYKVFAGKWQDIIPTLLEKEEKYDIIYFDTFGESYTQLKMFFQEYVPHILSPASPANPEGGKFGFFNGLGADRRVCYDVYQNVVEIDLMDVGMEVEWTDVGVEEEVCGKKEGEGEWEGVRRRYWVLDTYRLPVIRVVSGEVEE